MFIVFIVYFEESKSSLSPLRTNLTSSILRQIDRWDDNNSVDGQTSKRGGDGTRVNPNRLVVSIHVSLIMYVRLNRG